MHIVDKRSSSLQRLISYGDLPESWTRKCVLGTVTRLSTAPEQEREERDLYPSPPLRKRLLRKICTKLLSVQMSQKRKSTDLLRTK
eukprot:c3037_g1_i1 orf=83-340(+)